MGTLLVSKKADRWFTEQSYAAHNCRIIILEKLQNNCNQQVSFWLRILGIKLIYPNHLEMLPGCF